MSPALSFSWAGWRKGAPPPASLRTDLLVLAGADLRLGARALADFGPGSAFSPSAGHLHRLACGRAPGCPASALGEAANLMARRPALTLRSNRELGALFAVACWDPLRLPLRLPVGLAKRSC